MKRYQKIIFAFFVLAFVLAGSKAALSGMAQERLLAQEEETAAPGQIESGDMVQVSLPVAVPVPAAAMPGAVPIMQDDVTPPASTTPPADTTTTTPPITTTTTPPASTTASTSTPTPGTGSANLLIPPTVITVTPTPTPPILVTTSGQRPIITLDYTNYVAWLTVGPSDKYIVLEVMKTKKGKDGAVTYTPSAQYMYDLTEMGAQVIQKTIRIDLSFLKATSMQYIQIHGDANPANVSGVIAINPQPKKPSIKYAGGVFTAKIDKKDVILNAAQLDEYEYKTLYGSRWDSLRNYNGVTSSIAGTTILVREKATLTEPAGVELKLKIPAAAKAPKVTIDYVKGLISIPKGVEFKISALGKEGNWAKYKNEKGVEAAAKLTPSQVLEHFIPYIGGALTSDDKAAALEKNGFSVIARTAKVEKNGTVTKAASQPVFVTVPATTKVTKVENEDKIQGSTASVYLTYKNVEKGVELTAVGGNFDYSVDDGKNWKTIKADAKKPTVATLKKDAKAVLIRESGTKETTSKDGQVTPARLPSSNSISASWLPPLEIVGIAGQGFGVDGGTWQAGSAVELLYSVEQGKTQVTDATMKSGTGTTLPVASNLSISGGKITFTVPAYNESGTNSYVIEITAEKANYTSAVRKISVTVTRE